MVIRELMCVSALSMITTTHKLVLKPTFMSFAGRII